MSKMPAKKKSCFEITSVTQAKVAASSITDDTESLDDPDESRTEDVSSEIFDGSRGDQGVCDRSSSEETLNNVGESQEGQTHTAQPFAPTSTSFNSRFRVIKLDHGTGEPFRRGRWTCNEFYDKDSDSSVNRTVDSKKPTLTLDHSIDRDSGLGATTNPLVTSSIFSPPALENSTESGYSVGHLPHPSDPLQPGYSRNGGSAFQLPGYTTTVSQQPQQVVQPVAQTFPFNSLNGVHQGAILQNSHNMPPAPQQFAYPTHNPGLSAGQPDLCQQHFGSNTQNLPLQPASQVPLPSINPSGPGTQGSGGDTASAAGHQQPVSSSQPSGTTTRNSNVPNKLATGSTVPNTSQGVPDQGPGSGGPVQPQGAHGGASPGVSSGFSDHTEDSRQKSDALPQPSAGVVPQKDSVKPLFTEGLNLPTPAVKSLLDINNISVDVDEDRNPSTAFYQAFRPSRLQGSKTFTDSASGASVVAIDNKIEQAMDLVKSHLMYAVREEVEVLKEQIKELYERNSMLERENAVLKSLANSEQLNQLTNQLTQGIRRSPPLLLQQHPLIANSTPLTHHEGSQSIPHQPNLSSA